jgi:dihydroneopterin aldolase
MSNPIKTIEYAALLKNIKERITEAQYEALKTVNKEVDSALLGYWADDC